MNLTEATILALQGKLVEARSYKGDNERVSPREDVFTRDEKGVKHGVYDDNDTRNYKDRYKEPVYAKRNKVRGYTEKPTGKDVKDKLNKMITHTDYEKAPNLKSQKYKIDNPSSKVSEARLSPEEFNRIAGEIISGNSIPARDMDNFLLDRDDQIKEEVKKQFNLNANEINDLEHAIGFWDYLVNSEGVIFRDKEDLLSCFVDENENPVTPSKNTKKAFAKYLVEISEIYSMFDKNTVTFAKQILNENKIQEDVNNNQNTFKFKANCSATVEEADDYDAENILLDTLYALSDNNNDLLNISIEDISVSQSSDKCTFDFDCEAEVKGQDEDTARDIFLDNVLSIQSDLISDISVGDIDETSKVTEAKDTLKEYEVTMSVTGKYVVTVKAKNEKEAEKLAIKEWENADFGALEDIDCEVANTISLN